MSRLPANEPVCTGTSGVIELRIEPREKDLGEFSVRRVLPATARQMIGPFVFFDHMGPADFPPGKGIQVRPHPHIGIATVTYLFEGEIMHRDSLGYVQAIRPGAVNLMTAGRGIVHSERAGDDLDSHSRLHGIQSWMALPDDQEETDPAFRHVAAAELPEVAQGGVTTRVVLGEAYGRRSPIVSGSPTLYLECLMSAGSSLALPDEHKEIAAYTVSGDVLIDGANYRDGVMAVAASGRKVRLEAVTDCRVIVIGGDPLGERHLWSGRRNAVGVFQRLV
jgi:redox-sensitive bicupin YhaK (pirin superfamily)